MMPIIFNMFAGAIGSTCSYASSSFFGFPTWYAYLPGVIDKTSNGSGTVCSPSLGSLNDVWLILAAVIEILLRLAALAAVVFVIVGGIKFVTSQGEPNAVASARNTLMNAIIGLVIAVTAALLVNFIAGSFK